MRMIVYIYGCSVLVTCSSYAQKLSMEEIRRANRVTRGVHFQEVSNDLLRAIVDKSVVRRANKWLCTECNCFLKNGSTYSSRRSHLFGCNKKLRKRFLGPYVCLSSDCGKRLYHVGSIYAHVPLKHVARKYYRYACSFCRAKYPHKGMAQEHVRRKHDRGVAIIDRCKDISVTVKKRKRKVSTCKNPLLEAVEPVSSMQKRDQRLEGVSLKKEPSNGPKLLVDEQIVDTCNDSNQCLLTSCQQKVSSDSIVAQDTHQVMFDSEGFKRFMELCSKKVDYQQDSRNSVQKELIVIENARRALYYRMYIAQALANPYVRRNIARRIIYQCMLPPFVALQNHRKIPISNGAYPESLVYDASLEDVSSQLPSNIVDDLPLPTLFQGEEASEQSLPRAMRYLHSNSPIPFLL